MNKLRVSYSLLQMWQKDKNEAIQNYLHIEREKTQAQMHGLKTHAKWQSEILANNTLTVGSKVYTFKKPEIEKEIIQEYNDLWLVKGYIDCLDKDTIYEFKTGKISSAQYSHTMQIPFYFMLCDMAGIEIEKAIIIRKNKKEIDTALIWKFDEMIEEARNWIDSIAPEIISYFETHAIPM